MTAFSADADAFLGTVSTFALRDIEPVAEMLDRDAAIPPAMLERLAALDLLTIGAPLDVGGCGAGLPTALRCISALASSSPALALLVAAAHAAAAGVDPAVPSGSIVVGAPVAVVDTASVSVTGGDGGRTVLSGTAARVEHAGAADVFVVLSSGPAGDEVHAVPRAAPGVELGAPLGTTGLRPANARPVTFAAVAGARVGGAHQALELRRWWGLGIAAVAAGVAHRAFQEAAEHAAQRYQFGRPVGRFPALRAILDGCAGAVSASDAELWAATAGTTSTAAAQAAGRTARRAARSAVAVCLDAIQVHGGYGYVVGAPVERLLRDAVSLRALSSQVFLRAGVFESRQLTFRLLPDLTGREP